MATRTIARLYDTYDNAAAVVQELETAGFARDEISLVGRHDATGQVVSDPNTVNPVVTGRDVPVGGEPAESRAGTGATIGTVLGGGAGILAGLGSLAIPGVGPVIAAGWLVATLTGAGVGAAAGGLLGSLTGAGVSEPEAHAYAEGVRRGGALVALRVTDDAAYDRADAIMRSRNSRDASGLRQDYESAGWSRFDETDPSVAEADRLRSPGLVADPAAIGIDPAIPVTTRRRAG
jgi:hypothetical protein